MTTSSRYDPEADAAYFKFSAVAVFESEEVAPDFILDFDREGRITGFEVLNASRRLAPGILPSATFQEGVTDQAIQIVEASDAIDLDARESEMRVSGWSDETIQLAEERLVVGKREVERGSLRVRSYIVETPVSEQVTLRQETVGIEQRQANRTIGVGDDAFRDRTLEMRETGEEAVVGKQAFVTEEISLRKDVGQRTEEIRDTIRRTEVDVERVEGATLDQAIAKRI